MPLNSRLIRKLFDHFYKGQEPTPSDKKHAPMLTHSILKKMFEKGKWINNGYVKMDTRNLSHYNLISKKGLKFDGLTLVDYVLHFLKTRNRKLHFLDVGAGEGNVGKDLEKRFFGNVDYTGIDLQEQEYKKVKQLDVVTDKLPRESYDLIVSVFVFQYLSDKFSALENMINALSVGGILNIYELGSIYIKSKNSYSIIKLRSFLKALIKANPFLEIKILENSISITKRSTGNATISYKYLGVRPSNPTMLMGDLEKEQVSGYYSMRSYYQYDPNKKSKW